jgi:hypothetical protein
MSERDGYEPGVPCWVDTLQPDPGAAVAFYGELFGWEAKRSLPADSPRGALPAEYYMCRLRGRDVAAIGSQPSGASERRPVWGVYVWVEDPEGTASRAAEAGGRVLFDPFDCLDGGRMAVISDPGGAVLGIWQPGVHRGAQLVNEPGAWSMSALKTRDPDGAKAFYGAVFGWEAEGFELGGGEVALWRLPGYVGGEPEQPVPRDVVATMAPMGDEIPDHVAPHWSVDFWVDDVEAAAQTSARLGGSVVAPPNDIPGAALRQAVVADPQGAAFSVTELTAGG